MAGSVRFEGHSLGKNQEEIEQNYQSQVYIFVTARRKLGGAN